VYHFLGKKTRTVVVRPAGTGGAVAAATKFGTSGAGMYAGSVPLGGEKRPNLVLGDSPCAAAGVCQVFVEQNLVLPQCNMYAGDVPHCPVVRAAWYT